MKFIAVISLSAAARVTWAVAPKIILDNDWELKSYQVPLLALEAGWDVLGLVSDTADSWAHQAALHGVALLEIGNLADCIPVYKGADYPLLNTPELFHSWQEIHGRLAWQGAFTPENRTNEKLGNDPTSGDPQRIVKEAFHEGYPNHTVAGDRAAAWMIEQVHRYPGEVMIYSGGALTNIAIAVRLDPEFASLTKGLVVMGAHLDVNLIQATDELQANLWGDINLMMDPEASKIALTADFPSITVMGNGANQVFPTEKFLDEVYEVKNNYTALANKYRTTHLPFWDPMALFSILDADNIVNATEFYIDIDIAYNSPRYGRAQAYMESLKPSAQRLKKVVYPLELDGEKFLKQLKNALQHPKTCQDIKKLRKHC